ncbi:protein-lysine N-methyltransferase SMYD4-like [Lycorma delicatula]|uniref:protein-lysine N-methyltransferase SMYD4-like n=1 Tax=Lycorma delicatula TaxID=130591 RepID=UPI003F514320
MDPFSKIFERLTDKLKKEFLLEDTSHYFATLKSDCERFKFCLTLLENAKLLPPLQVNDKKNCFQSQKYRNEGNCLFLKKNDITALECYSMSIAFAPTYSEELALAYANRSAVSFSLNQFEDSIVDIDRALSKNYPDHLKYKLYERKGKCLLNLGRVKCAKDNYRNALNLINKSKLKEDRINNFVTALNKELNCLSENGSDCTDVEEASLNVENNNLLTKQGCTNDDSVPCLSYAQNSEVPAGCDAIKITYNETMGRHIVAVKDINPGDVLVVEQPYTSVLLPSAYNLYCFNCLRRSHTLIPCLECTKVLFCSIECRDSCLAASHVVECPILPHLISLGCSKLELLALRILLVASENNNLNSLRDYINNIDEPYCHGSCDRLNGFDDNHQYCSNDYRTIHHLATNSNLRTIADLFRRSCFACCIVHCVDQLTDYFKSNFNNITDNNDVNITSDNFKEYFENKCFAGGLLLRYLQSMPCNAHEVSEMCVFKPRSVDKGSNTDDNFIYDNKEIGGAAYPVLSLINHSCDPNVVRHSHNGDTVVLTAIQQIAKGEQILDNYGYHHAVHDLHTRQNHLFSQYHFLCNCIACVEDWPRYHLLPDKNIIYILPHMQKEVELSSKEFRTLLKKVLSGDFSGDSVLKKLLKHLSLLQIAVKRPWKEYSECQEAIKQALSMQANHYVQNSHE